MRHENYCRNVSFIFDQNELFSRMRLEFRDVQLLRFLFSAELNFDEKVDFFKSLDIEKEPMEFNLMLAHLCHRHGYKGIPSAIEPRIRGAARFYLFKNGGLFSSFRTLGKSLNKAGIPILLLKGAALKAVYDGKASRCLADIDFAVPKHLLQDAVKLAEKQNYRICNKSPHSIDMKQLGAHEGSIDIHFRTLKTAPGSSFDEELAGGARQIEAFGIDVWVPSAENLIVQLLENEFFNLCLSRENQRRFKWIYDCGMIVSAVPALSWSHIATTIKKYDIYHEIRSMLLIFSHYLPQYLPESILNGSFPQRTEVNKDRYIATLLKWVLQGAHREKLSLEGKKWQSIFLRPFQMATEYRFLRMEGTVTNLRQFILIHSDAKNFFQVMSWSWKKLCLWVRTFLQ